MTNQIQNYLRALKRQLWLRGIFDPDALAEALRQIQEDAPDLVLLDIQLPGMDGLEVLSRAKELDEELIVIMVTALGVLETAVKAMRMGAHDYINKPFNLDELLARVRALLRRTQPDRSPLLAILLLAVLGQLGLDDGRVVRQRRDRELDRVLERLRDLDHVLRTAVPAQAHTACISAPLTFASGCSSR